MPSRRKVLAGVGTAVSVSIAGCSSTGQSGGSGNSPEEVTREFYTAMGDGDIKTLETVIHNQSRRYPPREEVYADRNVTINRIEQLPIEEIDQELGGNGRYTEESLNRSLESLLDEAPAEEDRVVVLANVEINGQQSKVPVRVVRQNGEWAVIR